jgi:negative regulator of flagellin synthesis FlgM
MPTEINGLPRPQVSGTNHNSTVKTRHQEAEARGASAPAAGDSVSLTETSARLHDLERMAAAAPEADTKRVEEIRQAIADGRYKIDAARVADKLLSLEDALFTSSK